MNFVRFVNSVTSSGVCGVPGKFKKCENQTGMRRCYMSQTSCCCQDGYSAFMPCKCYKGQTRSASTSKEKEYMHMNENDQVEIVKVTIPVCVEDFSKISRVL